MAVAVLYVTGDQRAPFTINGAQFVKDDRYPFPVCLSLGEEAAQRLVRRYPSSLELEAFAAESRVANIEHILRTFLGDGDKIRCQADDDELLKLLPPA